ncbi:MAG: signal recognition particle-docking protein FtsY [Coriobacteriia bacterium]|nr:signal recognition particle-docking protein FtsY [Coriobacteriia bacterium]MCL2750446.1 signal recognition particle-docking protein FtsY [Coriobacteriia bacterium]
MAWFDRLSEGLSRTRQQLSESFNAFLELSPEVDDDFWDNLEETLIAADFGALAASRIVAELRDESIRKGLPDAPSVMKLMAQKVIDRFAVAPEDVFEVSPVCVLFVGINGAGKTTTVGKLAKDGAGQGRKVLVGSADTFRAAAIEQLDIWAERAQVPVIKRERGADPASVAFEVIEAAEKSGANLVLVDTAGRLHTSDDLMRELAKVVAVTRKRAASVVPVPFQVKTVLVLDATTGQNGLAQARAFNTSLELNGVIITKLDGTAKGGIAVAISEELALPIVRIGVGEKIDDLRPFNPEEFVQALLGS